MHLYRYSRWDGTQESFPLDAQDVLGQLSEHFMANGDVAAALRTLAQQGVQGRNGERLGGLQDLQHKLRQLRRELLDRYNLNGALQDVRARLAEVKRLEQQGLARREQDAAEKLQRLHQEGEEQGLKADLLRKLDQLIQKSHAFLERLPQEPAPAIQQLRAYEFMEPAAKEQFDRLLQDLQRRVLNAAAEELSERLSSISPDDLRLAREMLQDLNQLLEQRAHGEQPDFQSFMRKHGGLFGKAGPSSLDGLLDQLLQSGARMDALLNSLAPEQRRQLREALAASLQDPELLSELTRLSRNLAAFQADRPGGRDYPFQGAESLGFDHGLEVIEQLQRLDEAERQLKRGQQSGSLAEVDQTLLREMLGEEALREFQHLQQLASVLEDAGYLVREGNRFQLTPKGVRKVGQKALEEIFNYIRRDSVGQHQARTNGLGPELGDGTKRHVFGEPFSLDVQKTVFNAVRRGEQGAPIRLRTEDFEVHRTDQQHRSASVLMLDLSLSMAMRGNFLAAKKVALALDNLIRTQFPRDTLYIVGFSTYAREITADRLAYLSWDEFDPYTNIQHGLALAQKLLDKLPGGTKQIIMVSDGEPTAHLEEGHLFLQYPPSPRTLRETLREVKRCTSRGITINTFMLDRNTQLVEFVAQMTRINRGRVFYTSPDRLGQYVLVDYVTSRRRVLSA
ncbi:MAG: VWA domain-containing protein [Dehalococcoidia bacterium]|nr:VWA domain-containing protein [Dehalococcoidia bacterium]